MRIQDYFQLLHVSWMLSDEANCLTLNVTLKNSFNPLKTTEK